MVGSLQALTKPTCPAPEDVRHAFLHYELLRRFRLLHLQLDVQIAELFGLDGRRRIGHQVRALRGFGERDVVAEFVPTGTTGN